MLLAKNKFINAMGLGIVLLTQVANANTINETTSSFILKLFNNSNNSSLHYYVSMNGGKKSVEGVFPLGDTQGKTVLVATMPNKIGNAEIIVTDNNGYTIWDGKVSYYGNISEFNTQTMMLNPDYKVSTNAFPNEHAITFDIH